MNRDEVKQDDTVIGYVAEEEPGVWVAIRADGTTKIARRDSYAEAVEQVHRTANYEREQADILAKRRAAAGL